MTGVDIVGGGVAGLTLACALPQTWKVRLHEGAWDVPTVPTTFGMWPAAMRALDEIGVGDRVRAHGRHLDVARIHDRRGRRLTEVGGQDVWLIPRTTLVDLLRERLPEQIEVRQDRVDDPAALEGDLVVAADGVHSVVRRQVWGSPPARTGATAVRGVVDGVPQPTALEEFWGAGMMAGMTPQPGTGTNWFATLPQQRFASVEDALATVRERFVSFPEPLRRVLAAATPANTSVNDLWVSRWPGRLVRDPFVLIGDAAHAMTPNLGRGACEAILDAAMLGRLLRQRPMGAALTAYERRRLVPGQLVRVASRGVMSVATTVRLAPARDRVLAAVPSR